MKNISCKNCGGIMTLDASAMTATCRSCGSRYVLDHADTDYYMDFYRQMNSFLSLSNDDQERRIKADELWNDADEKLFTAADGKQISVSYLYNYSGSDADVYVARRNIIFHFHKNGAVLSELCRRNISMLDYPSADIRRLSDFFPNVAGGYELDDGTYILAVTKDEDEYPLSLFGGLGGRHVAWIISRMENLCCVLEFSGLVHPEIDPYNLFINPYTHQAALYGNWWKVCRNNSLDGEGRIMRTSENLIGLRNTASSILNDPEAPAALSEFIGSTPGIDAYEDFSYWDEMLIKAYGERKFINMDTDDSRIYGSGNKE